MPERRRPAEAQASDRRVVRLFGLDVATDFPFRTPLPPGRGGGRLELSCVSDGPAAAGEPGELLYRSPGSKAGEEALALYRGAGWELLRFAGIADFRLTRGRIEARPEPGSDPRLLEICLLGPVISYWLEGRRLPAMHASAIREGDGAVVFLAQNRGGKTSLAATFMAAGRPLLTDDVLALEGRGGAVWGRPGYPAMRMWPDLAARFLGAEVKLEPVHPTAGKLRAPVGASGFGSFCSSRRRLRAVYLPRRDPGATATLRISAVPRRRAVVELLRGSFAPRLVEAAGLEPPRLDLFARLARTVPLRRLDYPTGLDRLPEVRDAILQDLAKLP